MQSQHTIGSYLIERLSSLGVRHMFGIPGDYVLGLYKLLEESPIQLVGTTREDCAGFAADAYARVNGIGAACVTYCVGGLNTVNAVACAYAERSPVVLLSGSPGLGERSRSPLLHHMVRDFRTQRDVYEHITVASVVLDDPATAAREIDNALAALQRYKRPIYLEVPRDLVNVPIAAGGPHRNLTQTVTDPDALAEAVEEVRAMLSGARAPVALVGAEIHRFGLHDALLNIVESLNIPVASTLLGKSVIREDHPLYIGVYGSLIGRDDVNRIVDESDCLLILGSVLTDLDVSGARPPSEQRTVHATADRIAIKRHTYDGVEFTDFIHALAEADLPVSTGSPVAVSAPLPPRPLRPDEPATLASLFALLNGYVDEDTVVVADVGESLFASVDLRVHRAAEFLAPAYYTSMGFAVPAAVGAALAAPNLRPLVLVGDGAFQMTGTELSTCVRYGINPVVIVLNNRGYSTERAIMEGTFNAIPNWNYEQVCALIGGGVPMSAHTHGELAEALRTAMADRTHMYVLNLHLDPEDRSPAMQRVAKRLGERVNSARVETENMEMAGAA